MSENSVYQVPKRYPAAILLTRRENIENTHNNGKVEENSRYVWPQQC